MSYLIQHKCNTCGNTLPPELEIAGPHIKQTCSSCSRYVCFLPKQKLPDIAAIRQAIWIESGRDKVIIEQAKKDVEFYNFDATLSYGEEWSYAILQALEWWRVYRKVILLVAYLNR